MASIPHGPSGPSQARFGASPFSASRGGGPAFGGGSSTGSPQAEPDKKHSSHTFRNVFLAVGTAALVAGGVLAGRFGGFKAAQTAIQNKGMINTVKDGGTSLWSGIKGLKFSTVKDRILGLPKTASRRFNQAISPIKAEKTLEDTVDLRSTW
jgi:hypothetical protein